MYLNGLKLVDICLNAIGNNPDFKIIERNNPLCIHYNETIFFVFIKNISYAGKPYPINTTRAQLPKVKRCENIKKEEVFLFLGYDCDNDLYVCWDPIKTRNRLNTKNYVSFYSRLDIQKKVVPGIILEEKLSNGDLYVLFKSSDIALFFLNIENFFKQVIIDRVNVTANELFSDIDLYIKNLMSVSSYSKLDLLSMVMTQFTSKYKHLTLTNWKEIVEKFVD